MGKLTREQRALNVIVGKPVDYIPSQITIADRSKDEQVAKSLGLADASKLDDYLDNHLCISLTLCDTPLFYRNDDKKMEELEEKGYVRVDRKRGVVYDVWGMGVKRGEEGFFACYHPLQGDKKANEFAEPFLPERLDRAILELPFAEAVRKYSPPDPFKEGNYSDMERDLKAHASGDLLVVPSGYLGIYERAYSMMGFEEFMIQAVTDQESVAHLMDMLTDYKVAVAKKKVELGFKVGHYGDDLGTQTGPFISPKLFRELLLPRIKKVFKVFRDEGQPVIMHSCGNITQFIPELIDAGLTMLEPVQPCMDFELLKREFGDKLSFWGGIDTQRLLPFGTPEEVKEESRRVIKILGKGGRYMIAPSQEIMSDVPVANIVALLEVMAEMRTYV